MVTEVAAGGRRAKVVDDSAQEEIRDPSQKEGETFLLDPYLQWVEHQK